MQRHPRLTKTYIYRGHRIDLHIPAPGHYRWDFDITYPSGGGIFGQRPGHLPQLVEFYKDWVDYRMEGVERRTIRKEVVKIEWERRLAS